MASIERAEAEWMGIQKPHSRQRVAKARLYFAVLVVSLLAF
jgi:hypothetical protein